MATQKLVARLGLLCALAAVSAGCTVGTMYERYGVSAPVIVTVGCHSAYEVFENQRDRTIMVRTNAGSSLAGLFCKDGLGGGAPPRSPLQQAAEIHLAKTERPHCKIVDSRALSPMHTEFSYACTGPLGPGLVSRATAKADTLIPQRSATDLAGPTARSR